MTCLKSKDFYSRPCLRPSSTCLGPPRTCPRPAKVCLSLPRAYVDPTAAPWRCQIGSRRPQTGCKLGTQTSSQTGLHRSFTPPGRCPFNNKHNKHCNHQWGMRYTHNSNEFFFLSLKSIFKQNKEYFETIFFIFEKYHKSFVKINMNKEYLFHYSEVLLFPDLFLT